jgi:hypothetical protein
MDKDHVARNLAVIVLQSLVWAGYWVGHLLLGW